MAIRRSAGGVFFSAIQFLIRPVRRFTLSGIRYIFSPTKPPRGMVSIAPSNSGKAYNTTLCNPPIPLRVHE